MAAISQRFFARDAAAMRLPAFLRNRGDRLLWISPDISGKSVFCQCDRKGEMPSQAPKPMIATPQTPRITVVTASGDASPSDVQRRGDKRVPAEVSQLVAKEESQQGLPPLERHVEAHEERRADSDPPDPEVGIGHGDEGARHGGVKLLLRRRRLACPRSCRARAPGRAAPRG